MTEQEFTHRRAALVRDFVRLKQLRLFRCAAARVRQIAKLDFYYDGTPIEKTKSVFRYTELMK